LERADLFGTNYLSAQRCFILKPDLAFAAEVAKQSCLLLEQGEDEERKQIVIRKREGSTSEDHQ